MKCLKLLTMILVALTLIFTACIVDDDTNETVYETGDMKVYNVDSIFFKMAYISKDITFATCPDDQTSANVKEAYWISETEVTYELWYCVYLWATDTTRGENRYYFANEGSQGGGLEPQTNTQLQL